ncbi:MAG TPA: hypothetical protein VHB20_09740 [Verrucomicrobiae bacterium]|jgi:hypothetical protein|nr:hypothetical protein [Verrucomicrobiae bacterium]
MKLLKLSLIAGVAAVALGVSLNANAITVSSTTYTFSANPLDPIPDGSTSFDGSWITIDSTGNIINWDLVDVGAGGAADSNLPLTTSNSHVVSGGGLNGDLFYFTIASNDTSDIVAYFEGQNDLEGDLDGTGHFGSLYDGFGDPIGTWSGGAVPDSASTVAMFVGALTLLGVRKSFSRRS